MCAPQRQTLPTPRQILTPLAIANYTGVKLAPRDDPEKSVAPCKAETVFGTHYDTQTWTWRFPEEKLARLVDNIRAVCRRQTADAKTIHIRPLLPAGKFNIDAIMKLLASADSADSVTIPPEAKRQLELWINMLKACSSCANIPYPHHTPPPWALNDYTDAARGSADNPGGGTGGCMGDWWYWIPWPKRIQHGILKVDGKKMGRKLTALELIGPLVVIAANFEKCRYQPVTVWVDNSSSIGVWQKGYSNHCSLSNTISTIAAAGGCELFIRKITRCSTTGASVADHLSKGHWKVAKAAAAAAGTPLRTEPASIPKQFLRWIDRPTIEDQLGSRILRELAQSRPILGYST